MRYCTNGPKSETVQGRGRTLRYGEDVPRGSSGYGRKAATIARDVATSSSAFPTMKIGHPMEEFHGSAAMVSATDSACPRRPRTGTNARLKKVCTLAGSVGMAKGVR